MKPRFTFLGFELYWFKDRKGTPRVMRRTARKKLQGGCRRIKEWIRLNRHLNAEFLGHHTYLWLNRAVAMT
jgi:hypothetical protein